MNEDLSSLFEKLNINKDSISPDMINNLASMLNNKSNNSNSSSNSQKEGTSNSSTSNIDFETIMKMKTIIDKMNVKDDPRSNLLLSLKPYLKESRREKRRPLPADHLLCARNRHMAHIPHLSHRQAAGLPHHRRRKL